MLWENRSKKVSVCLMVVASCLVLATVWAVLAMPGTALAKKPAKPPGKDELNYTVKLVSHSTFEAPTYCPPIDAETRGGIYSAWFERHDLAATVVTSTGYELKDDISLHIGTNRDGNIISFQLFGQDMIGRDGIMHQSEVVTFAEPVEPKTNGFTLHVDVDNLKIWKTNRHLRSKKPKLVEMVGKISVGDLVYTPLL